MSVDHRGLHILVTEQFLNRSNIVAIFKKVGGKGMAEGMRGNWFVDFGEPGGLFDGPLEVCLIQVVTLLDTADGVDGEIVRWKNVLPGKFAIRVRVFPFQGIGKVD